MEGIRGHHHAGQIEGGQKLVSRGDLVAFGTLEALLGDDGAFSMDQGGDQPDSGGADHLAIDGDGLPGGVRDNILGENGVEGGGVNVRKDSPDRGLAGREKGLLGGRPAAPQTLELVLGEILGPARDPFIGALSRKDRGEGEKENGEIVVPDTSVFSGILHRLREEGEESVFSLEVQRGKGNR